MSVVNRSNCLKICISDLNRKGSIELRSVRSPKFGESKSTIVFSVVAQAYFKIVTVTGSKRFSGVVIDKKTTHLFTTRWSPSLNNIDAAGEHFIKHDNRYFRVMTITDFNEQKQWLIFQCRERGISSNEETDA